MYVSRKCDVLEQNSQYFWNQQPKSEHKETYWVSFSRTVLYIGLLGCGNKRNPSYSTPVLNPAPCICVWAARHHRNIHTLTTTKHLVQTTREESATGCVCVDGGGCSRHRGEWDVMKLKAEKFASGAAVMWFWQYVPTTLSSVMYLFALLEIKMLCEGTANKNISDVNECTVKNYNKYMF